MLQAEVILAEKEKVASLFKDGYFFCEVFKVTQMWLSARISQEDCGLSCCVFLAGKEQA